MFNLNLTTVSSHPSPPLNSPRHFLSGIKVKLGLHKISKQVEDEISKIVQLTFEEFSKSHQEDQLEEKRIYKILKECLSDAFTKSVQALMQKQKERRGASSYGQEVDFITAIQTEAFLCNLQLKFSKKKIWSGLEPFLLTQLAKIISPVTKHVVEIAEETVKEMSQTPNCREKINFALNKTIDKAIQDVIKTKLCLTRSHLSLSQLAQMPSFLEELKLQIQDSDLQAVLEEKLQKKVDQLLLNKFHRAVRTELVKVIDETIQALISNQEEAFDEQSIERMRRLLLRALSKAAQETMAQLLQEASQKGQQLQRDQIAFSMIAKHLSFLEQLKNDLENFPKLYQFIFKTLEIGSTYKLRRLTKDFNTVIRESSSLLSENYYCSNEMQLSQLLDQLEEEELKESSNFKIHPLTLNNTLINLDPHEDKELCTTNPKMVKAIKKLAELPQKQRAKGYLSLFNKICDLDEACTKIDPIELYLQTMKRLLRANATNINQSMLGQLEELLKRTDEQLDLLEKTWSTSPLEESDSESEKDEASKAILRINSFNKEWMEQYATLIMEINSTLCQLQLPSTPRSFNKEEFAKKYEGLAELLEKKVVHLKELYFAHDFEIIQKEMRKRVVSFFDGLHSSAAQLFKKQNGHLIQKVQAIGDKRNFFETI